MSMAAIVTVGSSKGGSGKTTMSVLIAGELANQGHKVLLVDTDIQKSSLKWYNRCIVNDAKPNGVDVIGAKNSLELSNILEENSDKDVIIVDTAGFASEIIFQLARVSDLFVLPCKISSLDAVEILDFVSSMRSESKSKGFDFPKYKVVLNEYDPIVKGAKSFENVHRLLTAGGVIVSDILLQKRERFKQVTEGMGSLYQIKTKDKATENAQTNVHNLVYDLFNANEG